MSYKVSGRKGAVVPSKNGRNDTTTADPYSLTELRELWRGFQDQPDELTMLMDFGQISRDEAQRLIRTFRGEPPEPNK